MWLNDYSYFLRGEKILLHCAQKGFWPQQVRTQWYQGAMFPELSQEQRVKDINIVS
jgi:hypothetical protein